MGSRIGLNEKLEMVVRLRCDYIWGDARRFLGKQVSRLSVSAMILLTANNKDFSLRSK